MANGDSGLTSVELFTGAGGLALGVARAGFEHLAVVEWNRDACETLRRNRLTRDWPVHEGDVRAFDFRPLAGQAHLLAAGAPCQPFSLGGLHRGHRDDRNLFPEVLRAVRELRPEAVLVENVKGILRRGFRPYFEYILLQLSMPCVAPRDGEPWTAHKARLLRERGLESALDLTYRVAHQLVNCADYGVPQRRDRVFVVAFRSDLGVAWTPMPATHSRGTLLHAQLVTGGYWKEHGIHAPSIPNDGTGRLAAAPTACALARWRTLRDALRGLPKPTVRPHPTIHNHVHNPGARSYPGHDGSPLDFPGKTLKAGVHGVPGGENTVRLDDGSVRYLTVREAARVQTFPDAYRLFGAWGECMRQLGNAVPVEMARLVASRIAAELWGRNSAAAGAELVHA